MRLVKIDGCLININEIQSALSFDGDEGCQINFINSDSPIELSVSVETLEDAIASAIPLLLTEAI